MPLAPAETASSMALIWVSTSAEDVPAAYVRVAPSLSASACRAFMHLDEERVGVVLGDQDDGHALPIQGGRRWALRHHAIRCEHCDRGHAHERAEPKASLRHAWRSGHWVPPRRRCHMTTLSFRYSRGTRPVSRRLSFRHVDPVPYDGCHLRQGCQRGRPRPSRGAGRPCATWPPSRGSASRRSARVVNGEPGVSGELVATRGPRPPTSWTTSTTSRRAASAGRTGRRRPSACCWRTWPIHSRRRSTGRSRMRPAAGASRCSRPAWMRIRSGSGGW